MDGYKEKLKRKAAAVHQDQMYMARCSKGCKLGKWTYNFCIASDYKKFHEQKYPDHHVYIDVKKNAFNIYILQAL